MNRGEDEPLEPSNGTLRTPISVVITADEKTYNCNEAITEKTMSGSSSVVVISLSALVHQARSRGKQWRVGLKMH